MLRRLLNNFMQMLAKETRKRTAAEDGLVTTDASVAVKREKLPKKIKYAMLLSYQGHAYFGMQVQPDIACPTIESHLLDAMLKQNFITEAQRKDPYSFHFQRCARTDRHVSAVRQVCSMDLRLNDDFVRDGADLLNKLLPDDIRVFGIKRTVPSFHAQKYCDGRTYSYTIPTFAFAACDEVTSPEYRITTERIAQIDELLSLFHGSHNYYNYTAKLEHMDQRCKRLVYSFKCDKPFIYMDSMHNFEMEFITLYVHGQSFIMHQIRKMIGAVLCVLRGFMYKSDIVRSFLLNRMDIPRAPGLGLLLEKVHFDRYEKRFGRSHGSLNDWGEETEAAVLDARDRLIVQRILREESETQSMMEWLATLPLHQYVVDPEDATGTNVSPLYPSIKALKAEENGDMTTTTFGDDDDEDEVVVVADDDDDGGDGDTADCEHFGAAGRRGGDADDERLMDGAVEDQTETAAEEVGQQQNEKEEGAEMEKRKIAAGAIN